jgi:hypothetical protein
MSRPSLDRYGAVHELGGEGMNASTSSLDLLQHAVTADRGTDMNSGMNMCAYTLTTDSHREG